MLSIENLSVGYGSFKTLQGIELGITSSEIVCVLGPNGSGKTTLLRSILGILPRTGDIRINGVAISQLPRREIARNISYVPQSLEAQSPFTVEEYIDTAMYASLVIDKKKASRQAMIDCQCIELAGRAVSTLSGGERQRVLIASAVAQNSPFILLDEPFASMDVGRTGDFVDLFLRLRQAGRSMLIVMHDLNWATLLADRIIYLQKGQLVFSGTCSEFLMPETLDCVFGESYLLVDNPEGDLPIVIPRRRRG
jgi:iron complex transport system ATP-binding protein